MLFQEKLGLLYFKVSILLFFLTFLRLKLDMIKPILDYEDKWNCGEIRKNTYH